MYVVKQHGNGYLVMNKHRQWTPVRDMAHTFTLEEALDATYRRGGAIVGELPPTSPPANTIEQERWMP